MKGLLVLVIAVCITGVEVCNIKMCLTWTVQKDHLDLTCKVSFLKYSVEFYNNNNNEQGYCLSPLPSTKCIPKYPNTVMRQNATTNITYLKILGNIDSHFNGKWECRHGTKRDHAFVNITVLQAGIKITEPKLKSSITDVKCWQSYLSYSMVGFGFTILTVAIIYIISLWCCFCFRNEDNWCNRVERDMKRTCNGSDKGYTHTIIDSARIGVFLILFIILLVIPFVKGLQDDNTCRGEELYLILGSFLAFVCIIPTIRLTKVNEEGYDESAHSMEEQDLNEDSFVPDTEHP